VPGAFKGHIGGITGVTIVLAVEPEPACLIETAADAVDFFTAYLFDHAMARAAGLSVDEVRRHVGVCFDACHMAVEFEDHAAALASLDGAGIRVPKFQISSALRVADPSAGSRGRHALERFAEDVYLHQVVERTAGGLRRFVDLPDALNAAAGAAPPGPVEWRVHFHVPIFMRQLGDLETTQPDLEAVINLVRDRGDRPCLEVETYTWDVLPPEHRTSDLSEAIARELAWARERMES
jgi:sugar phosphate isomerase/epimerase